VDEKTRALISQLADLIIGTCDGQITQIVNEARDEALAEAKALIKEMMVQAILEHALDKLEGLGSSAVPVTLSGGAGELRERSPAPSHPGSSTQTEEQIRQEIEAIRRKIAENERLLSQVKASSVGSEETREPSVEQKTSAPKGSGEEDHAYYVYGIVSGDGSRPIEGLPQVGIDPAYPVYALPYQAIQAIVSRVSLPEFGQAQLEANLNDIEWLKARVYAHQNVLDAVLASHTLVPVRFCTIYRSESGVREMLAQHYDDFVAALARLKGRQEWGVKVYCDRETLIQKIEAVSDRVKELRTEIARKPEGMAYFLKKRVEEAIAEEVERVSDEYAQRSHDRLTSRAEEAVVLPLQGREITGREEEMILNGAYLVASERLAAFQSELASLEKEYTDLGFRYEMTGPWPPYNFVAIGSKEDMADESVGG